MVVTSTTAGTAGGDVFSVSHAKLPGAKRLGGWRCFAVVSEESRRNPPYRVMPTKARRAEPRGLVESGTPLARMLTRARLSLKADHIKGSRG